jgi:hypothetical protein
MTTQAGPDGQQASGQQAGSGQGQQQQGAGGQQGSSGGGGAEGEQWRNVGEVKKIIGDRDKYKAEADEAKRKLAEVEAKERDAGKSDEAKRLAAIERERDEAKNKLAESDQKIQERDRKDRKRAIVDAILESANPERKEELRLMLPGLHEDGELDLYAEDAKKEGKSALEKLRKRLPGVEWMQLTPEEQRSMSPEDFRKHFGRGGTSRRKTALFG